MDVFNLVDVLNSINDDSITQLDLSCTAITDDDAVAIAVALCKNTRRNCYLEAINLSMNPLIGVKGLTALCESFNMCHSLTAFTMVNCDMDTEESKVIAEMLKNNTTLIQSLFLSDNIKIGVEGVSAIIDACLTNTVLKCLHLRETIESFETVEQKVQLGQYFCGLLQHNDALQKLCISKNALDDAFIHSFTSGLRSNKTMMELTLWENEISDEGAKLLAVGVQVLAHSLRYNSSLESLDLSDNNFGELGVQSILECIGFNETLQNINLLGANIPKVSRKSTRLALFESLQYNDTIRHIWLTGIDEYGDDIEQVLQKNWERQRIAPKKGQRRLKEIAIWMMERWASI